MNRSSRKGHSTSIIVCMVTMLVFSICPLRAVYAAGPEASGWYAGDMHVHRSCGAAPESVPDMYTRMTPNTLSFMTLLADMGNGEVRDPATDLPLVTGSDALVSTPTATLHWDAEWHWDATYDTYPHQALGGHVVSLGISPSETYPVTQVWEEYTYPIFEWAHQRSAVAGFVHMQFLDGSIPQALDCCTPLEYPVEVALGSADFIAEDMNGGDSAIEAYYRLLNTGFRPGFAAGTDYPCNGGANPGSLLTYVQVAGGEATYRNWINGIASGRTVVSRNGHNEFLNFTVNGGATPGDEIKLAAAGSVPVTITWTANQDLTGTVELVKNGVVIAGRQASVSAALSSSLSTTVDFAQSGWLAARRMDTNGHVVHTGAVFVIVNNAPVRASVADADFFVQWTDNLLTKTSAGGDWNSFFSTSLSQAQTRYQSAKALYQQRSRGRRPDPGHARHRHELAAGCNEECLLYLHHGGERRNCAVHLVRHRRLAAHGPVPEPGHRRHLRDPDGNRRFQRYHRSDRFRNPDADSLKVLHAERGARLRMYVELHHLA